LPSEAVRFELAPVRSQAPLGATPFHEWVFPGGDRWAQFFRAGPDYILRFPELADFEVSSCGRVVSCRPVASVSEDTVRHLYLNQVLPLALSQQGALVFHASAVDIGGKGVAFVGDSRKGKSTLAASFATNGSAFLTDDGLVLEPLDKGHQIVPSHPSIRLWKDSEEFLVGTSAPICLPVHFTSKARLLADGHVLFCEHPRPLHRVYFLGGDSSAGTAFERIRPAAALIELVRNSFLLNLDERESLAGHFDELIRFAGQPIFYRMDYPRRYEELANVRRAIVDHATFGDQVT
jgi:hypothetical protein